MRSKGIFVGLSTLILAIAILLSSCRLEESYKSFSVEGITSYDIDQIAKQYTSGDLAFAQIDEVVFLPEIKMINYDEYVIYISCYSETGSEQVTVESVQFKDDKKLFFNQGSKQSIIFQTTPTDGMFEGWIESGVFTATDEEIVNRKKFYLETQIQVTNGKKITTEKKKFEITIVGHWGWVTPT